MRRPKSAWLARTGGGVTALSGTVCMAGCLYGQGVARFPKDVRSLDRRGSIPAMIRLIAVTVFTALAAAGCERETAPPRVPAAPSAQPATPSVPAAQPPAATAPPAETKPPADGRVAAGGLSFPVPEGWRSVPPSNAMREAELVFADPADPGRICVAALSRAGGDVQSNINRWSGQVLDSSGQPASPTVSQATVNGMKVHLVELVGKYQDGMPGGAATPRENWMMRGAIIEGAGGPGMMVFVKMTGPADLMASCSDGWKQLIDGVSSR